MASCDFIRQCLKSQVQYITADAGFFELPALFRRRRRPAHGGIGKGQTRELKSNHGRTHLNGAWHDRAILHRQEEQQEEKITGAAMLALFEDRKTSPQDIPARHPVATAIPGVIDNAKYHAKYNVSRESRGRSVRALPYQAGCPPMRETSI